ncbi:MAG: serine/threonine protein kinase [Gloeocapsa sp. DLM2.Bin57]|nr:MAG: serine/threonine protein kinase [Gloeocapsa sp. DLM2.Bin57]
MTNSQIPDFKVIYLQELLNNTDNVRWNDLSQKIVNPDSVKLIINCQGVNPSQLNSDQLYKLFYSPQQQNWGFADYPEVFQNITDEMADFIDKVINNEIIIEKLPEKPPPEREPTQEIPNPGNSSQSDTQPPPPPSPDDPSPGTIIKYRYEIIRKLSEGSFGKTYLAKDRDKPGHPNCVVKLLKPSVSSGGTISRAKRLFEQEADILHGLNHYCIPKLFAYFAENQRFYLVQEYIEGDTLDQIIPGSHPWTQQEVIKLLEDILEPLACVHQQNIIHRDIKPANLIRRQQDQKIVLIDFGAIKQVTEQANKSGTIIGSKGYMPVEQEHHGNTKFASDLYAVGMVAIQAATGCRLNELGRTPHGLIWEDKAINLDSPLKEFINKLTKWDYQDRYPSAQEALEALKNIPPPKLRKPRKSPITKIILAISSVVALAGIGLGVKSIPYLTKPKLSVDTIKIGHLWYPDDYLDLESHLEAELVPANYWDFLKGKKINVIIEGDRSLSYQEARNRIAKRQWDIAFTLSPINSIWAIDHDYTYLAAMFPESTYYEGGLFVRRDSPIQSIDDLGPTTIIALGGLNSASSFYMPAYTLYGKTVSVDTGNRGQDIVNKIKQGEVDAGAAAIGDSIRKDDPDLRIIHVSGAIPGSGVYLSPDLSRRDRQSLTQVMLNASEDIKEQANYGGDSPEPDYTEFRKIMARVDEILICSDFSKNPVNFFCPDNITISEIRAKVNGSSFRNNQYLLKAVGADNQIYNVTIDPDLFQSIVGSDKLTDIHNKNLVITIPGEPTQTETGLHIPITQAQQLQIVD